MKIYGWKLFAVYHHLDGFGDHRHCDRRKNASSKHESYKFILPLKKFVDLISTRREKNATISTACFEKKDPKV